MLKYVPWKGHLRQPNFSKGPTKLAKILDYKPQCPILHIEKKNSPAGFRTYLHLVIHEYTLKSHFFPNFNDLINKKSSFTIFIHKIEMRKKLSEKKSPQCYAL